MKVLAFDVDGTVLNTLDSIIYQVNKTLVENKFNEINDRDFFKKILGYGSKYLIAEALAHQNNNIKDENIVNEILEYYLNRYNSEPSYLTKPYEGIPELLEELKKEGYTIICYSNKPDDVLQKVMNDILPNKFDEVCGILPNAPTKPDPTVLLNLLKKYNVNKEEACYIGDSDVDMQTAQNAGVHAIAVSWGFRSREFLEKLEPEYIADNTEELKKIIDNLKK